MSRRAQILFGALLVTAVGCRQIASIDDPTPPTSTTREAVARCGVSFAGSSCASCMATSCCAQADRCGGNAECEHFFACLSACSPLDAACGPACRDRFPSGYGFEAADLQACEASQCAGPCGVTCGGYVYADAECASCATSESSSCDLAAACVGDVECSRLASCERDCAGKLGVPACLQRCEIDHPSGVAAERAFGASLAASCKNACVAAKWACLRHPMDPPSPPVPPPPSVNVTYRLLDLKGGRPLEGFTLRACARGDFACVSPRTSTTTNPQGQGTLAVAADFAGFTEISGTDYGPIYLYLPRLLYKDVVLPDIGVLSRAEYAELAQGFATPNVVLKNGIVVRAFDCSGQPAAGVRFAIDASEGLPFYTVLGIPAPGAIATDEGSGTGGYGGFLNVRENTSIRVQATVVANGLQLPPADVVVRANPAVYTEVLLFASPP